jgi:putative two-component system response regulator
MKGFVGCRLRKQAKLTPKPVLMPGSSSCRFSKISRHLLEGDVMKTNGNKGSILIIDDDLSAQKSVESLLMNNGYDLLFASNGFDGLRLAFKEEPDLILLDVMMPEMNGFEVCDRLRSSTELAEVPILMISALDDRDSRLAGLQAGVDDFISKPFDRNELRARVRSILRLNRYRKLRDEHANLEKALRELQLAYDKTIEGWVKALDIRDHETEGHTQRVTKMTIRLAKAMGITDDQVDHIRRGALLHDVGKLSVPDAILCKPDKLTDEEWEIMRLHTTNAYEWLRSIEYLQPAIDIPHYHHEKWDGTGYPSGLSGEEIPLSARIFAVVDVWDALSSDRYYRDAWPRDKVLHYIEDQAGKHFDPQVAEMFIQILAEEETNKKQELHH